MPIDPQSTTETIIGVKYSALIAGFLGAAVSLSYTKELTKPQMLGSVAVGTITAVYGAPLAMHYLGLSETMERAISFFIGLVAMRAIPIIMDHLAAFIPSLNKPDTEK